MAWSMTSGSASMLHLIVKLVLVLSYRIRARSPNSKR